MHIFFDGIEIDEDYVTGIEYEGKLFDDNDVFTLGSTNCNQVTLRLSNQANITTPSQVIIQNTVNQDYLYLNVDNVNLENNEIVYSLVDNMVKFNFRYDASELINNSQHQEQDGTKYVYLYEIAQDICSKAGVTLATNTFLGYQKHITWYDNTITAREYIGMIAELNGGYAIIIAGNLYFLQYSNNSYGNINITNSSRYVIGENHIISKVMIENGLFEPIGDNTGNIVRLNPNNVYITEQSDLTNIYNVINGFEYCNAEIEMGNMDVYTSNIGTILTVTVDELGNTINIINQINASYNSAWQGKYFCNLSSTIQEETSAFSSIEDNYKRLKFQTDRNTNTIEMLSEETFIISDVVKGTNTISLSNAYAGPLHYLKITGQIDCLYPRTTIYPQNTLYPQNGVSLQVDTHYYQLDIDVLNYISPSVCDQYIYEDGKSSIYRMVEVINGVKTPLATPYYEPRSDILIEVNHNSSLTILGYSNITLESTYLLQNDYTSQFANKIETHSSIELTNDRITQTVQAVSDGEGKITPASIVMAVNNDESSIKLEADKIDLTGYVTVTDLSGTGTTVINGSNITTGSINAENVDIVNLRANDIQSGTLAGSSLTLTSSNFIRCYGSDNKLDVEMTNVGLKFYDNSGDYSGLVTSVNTGSTRGVGLGTHTGSNHLSLYKDSSNNEIATFDAGGGVYAYSYHQISTADEKENIKLYKDSAIDKIKNTNIYQFNYIKDENKRSKVGFIIGDNYNTASEIVDNNSIDLYNVCGILWKAIQEQQEQIDNLQKEINKLKEEK